MSGAGQARELAGNQALAVEPADSVWLSASAGTGKTQVLSSRVLRLLLQEDVDPSQILCLTFTKAGATEMAARINETLAGWVRMKDAELAGHLKAIGADIGPGTLGRARTLFAAVLDCPGGGLRIDTIHAFAQWLLGAFPHEAGLLPGTRAMEDRDRALLARQVLADLLLDAEARGDARSLDTLTDLAVRFAPEAVEGWLLTCAEARDLWFGDAPWQGPLHDRVRQLLGLAADASAADLLRLVSQDVFPVAALRACMATNAAWSAKTGQEAAAVMGEWLSSPEAVRLAGLDDLAALFLTAKGEPRASKSQEKIDPAYPLHAAAVIEGMAKVRELRALLDLAGWLTPALELGRAYAFAWDEAKKREGLIDFDDQIREAAALLDRSELADWIRYKLDRRFDHILVDEAQDTNAAQWRIIKALTGDFFAGEGARADRLRTLFVVGDYKQAIFRFQGTSPENFARAQEYFREVIGAAAVNASTLRANVRTRELQELGLEQSFRTASEVLGFVDAAIAELGHQALGLQTAPEAHKGQPNSGYVALWQAVRANDDNADDEDEGEGEGWVSGPERKMADRIADQVKQWLDSGFLLHKGGQRVAKPGDIMVLVRKRRELAGLIVARLHAAGVPVAGVDRLRLGAPLAVRDVMAALRFAVQPWDCLNLAELLVSPLIGWTQKQLLEHGWRGHNKVRLWDHLRRSGHADVATAMERLLPLLRAADNTPPQVLLHWLLAGPWQGRKALVARLGVEANDPLDELVNAARAYAQLHVPSLAGFIAWFDAGEGELKRETGKADDLVRVMTVHGSKGLESPIVILADATGNPDARRGGAIDLPEPFAMPGEEPRTVPLPALAKEARLGRIAEADAQAREEEAQEHWRLLYVAMTRAEEALFIGGALGKREKEPAPGSWYARLAALFPEDVQLDDPIWGARSEWGTPPGTAAQKGGQQDLPLPPVPPVWATRPLAAEPRPPRPLAPSSLGEDAGSDPPLPPGALAEAARRGVLVHRLLERLPAVPLAEREAAAARWLARQAGDMDEAARAEIAASARRVLAEPGWEALFGPHALAEVPVAALVGTQVIAGTIDRLVIEADRLLVVDFKTARRPPAGLSDLPLSAVRQMAAYVAALEVAYPGRRVEAALLYTHAPRLIALPDALLAPHKQALLQDQ